MLDNQHQKVTATINYDYIKVYIDNKLHIAFKKEDFIGLQSWIENKDSFYIEIYTTKLIKVWYKNRSLWEEILKVIDKSLS